MTIHLPNGLETSMQAAVQSGRFASVDDAMAEAARLLLRTIAQEPPGLRGRNRAVLPRIPTELDV
jgi:Arc/MetJ-type ribon-helix-helix transcriptional regulator